MGWIEWTILIIVVAYLGIGFLFAWTLTSGAGEDFTFDMITLNFILKWPFYLLGGRYM